MDQKRLEQEPEGQKQGSIPCRYTSKKIERERERNRDCR